MTAARTVRIEVLPLDPLGDQPLASRRCLAEGTGRRDVVGRYRVAENEQRACIADVAGLDLRQFEKGWTGDVGRRRPIIHLAAWRRHGVPQIVAGGEVTVATVERVRIESEGQNRVDFVRIRPDVAQIDGLPVLALAQRLAAEVDVGAPG